MKLLHSEVLGVLVCYIDVYKLEYTNAPLGLILLLGSLLTY